MATLNSCSPKIDCLLSTLRLIPAWRHLQSGGFDSGFGRKMLQFGGGFSQNSNNGFSQDSDRDFNSGLGRTGFNDRFASAEAQATAISSGGGNSEAFAQATAVAFHNGGSDARAYANAISEGIRQHGCRFYQTVIAQVRPLNRFHS